MAGTEINETVDPYRYFLSFELRPETPPERAEELIWTELEEMARAPLAEEELRRARNQCRAAALADFESTFDQAVQLGMMEVLGKADFWPTFLDRVEQVEAEDLMDIARRRLDQEGAVIGCCPVNLEPDEL